MEKNGSTGSPHRKLVVFIILLLTLSITVIAAGEIRKVTTSVDFSQVGQGSLLLRDENDRVYSAVITSYEGFKEFLKAYPIDFNMDRKDFRNFIYITVFSDNHYGIVVDGFKRTYSSSHYYIDVADSGVEAMVSPPPKGKKYTAYAVIRVSDRLKISHAGVRERVQNGLTKWYPYPAQK